MPRKELSVELREITGKKVARLRRAGIIPANVFGHNLPSVAVQLPVVELQRTLKASTVNEVIDLKVEGERVVRPMIINHVQRDALTSAVLHADFYQVSLRERMRADVPIILTGTSEAVVTFNGVLIQPLEVLHIEALPLDIPTHIEVDVSALDQLDMSVHVRDLAVPEAVTVLNDPDVVVVKVEAPRISEELEAERVEIAAGVEAAAAAEAEAATTEAAEESRA
jgi:large subunit ribosomal protein L25